jgi:hypothetical protein
MEVATKVANEVANEASDATSAATRRARAGINVGKVTLRSQTRRGYNRSIDACREGGKE